MNQEELRNYIFYSPSTAWSIKNILKAKIYISILRIRFQIKEKLYLKKIEIINKKKKLKKKSE